MPQPAVGRAHAEQARDADLHLVGHARAVEHVRGDVGADVAEVHQRQQRADRLLGAAVRVAVEVVEPVRAAAAWARG
jgi:hypothetical protein